MVKSVAVIGVGSMGRPMAENLIRGGYEVQVCDIRDAALAPFRAKGIRASTRASDCAGAAMIIIMVGNDADVRDVVQGPHGLLSAIDVAAPPLVAIMSSVLPRTIKESEAALAAKGAAVVDAPVSGGPVRAADATISIMAGGGDALFAKVQPVLDTLGRPIFRCGPVGAAAGVKIVNNILGVANMLLMGEAAHLATTLGIDLPFLTGVMEVSSGRSFASKDFAAYRALHMANARDPDVTGRLLAILKKDLKLARTLAGEAGVSAPILDSVSSATDQLTTDGLFARWHVALGRYSEES
jgi:3-hydroxyisobutyrate dehydrogenase